MSGLSLFSHVNIRLNMTTKSSYQLHLHELKHYMKLDVVSYTEF